DRVRPERARAREPRSHHDAPRRPVRPAPAGPWPAAGARVSVHLVGGGWQDRPDGVAYRGFVAEATARAAASRRDVPRVAVVAVRDGDGDAHAAKLVAAVAAAGPIEDDIPASVFAHVDGIVVGGG